MKKFKRKTEEKILIKKKFVTFEAQGETKFLKVLDLREDEALFLNLETNEKEYTTLSQLVRLADGNKGKCFEITLRGEEKLKGGKKVKVFDIYEIEEETDD